MQTLTVTFNLIPAPVDIAALVGILHKTATDIEPLAVLPTVLALRDANGALLGAASFLFREEADDK
jgi:hypothetical protein